MTSSFVNLKLKDEGRLAELGYTQELRREWSWLHNFGASYSIIVRTVAGSERCEEARLTVDDTMTERCDRHHNPLPLRLEHWWSYRYDYRLDSRQLLYITRWGEHG